MYVYSKSRKNKLLFYSLLLMYQQAKYNTIKHIDQAKYSTVDLKVKNIFSTHHLELFDWSGSHLVRVGGGLLLVALAVAALLIVAALLAVLGLVASLGAGVGVLLTVASLAEGVGGGLLFLRWHVCTSKGAHPARLLENEPQVADPQDHVDEAEGLRSTDEFRRMQCSFFAD